MQANVKKFGEQFVNFLNNAVSPYHVVEECSKILRAAGFIELKEGEQWKVEPLNKYYLTRNKSCIVAFAVGGEYKPGNGFSVVAAHTDSPCLKVKPVSRLNSGGCLQVGVSTYGGGLWRTWFDRDLAVAGMVIVKNKDSLEHRLVHIRRPILSIPNLAIHLETDREKFTFNKEDHLRPILASQVAAQLNNPTKEKLEGGDSGDKPDHHPEFLNLVAKECGLEDPSKILEMELNLLDAQPAAIGGLYEEFVSGGRLDNLVGTYTAIMALIQSCVDSSSLKTDKNIRMAACYDNEECGSESAQGAGTSLTVWILKSADQAHAFHPNYKGKHEENHQVGFHKGVVVKINANQRYASTPITQSILAVIAEKAEVKLQKFVVRNDSPCGSTVGPILSAKLGMQTIDVGTTQLAMHSIREIADVTGIYDAQRLYKKFYEIYPEVQDSVNLS